MQGINIFNVLLAFSLIACSNTADSKSQQLDGKAVYTKSENDLNSTYLDIKNYIRDSQVESKYLVETQRTWLKNRNLECQFDGKNANTENYKCLSDSNNLKTKDLKENYLNFESLENHLIKPFKYIAGTQKKLEVGDCWCNESMIKIVKDKIYIYQACDEKLKEPRIYRIVGKKINEFSVEYGVDTNNNNVPDFNLSFVTSGKNVWNIVPTVFRKQDLINLNFSINYTTDKNLKTEKLNCENLDE
ncbi:MULTISPECIES: lysozyme inhibitor LprI family protein [Acinetobacter]|uniref:lysozyme inhibitor LprI family protein n=1 Tax=Acinetobacter TaxID=469 RepID=UPI0006F5A0B2|nr:lysozyme inhibitor LprI family protein [Acinetobacter sp. Root1280]KQW86953.1 hypothetical protein ASC84_14620 [Acinetobacter sp. Root1280]